MRLTTNIAILSLLAVTGFAHDQTGAQQPDYNNQSAPPANMQRYPAPMDYPPQGAMPQNINGANRAGYPPAYAQAAPPARLTVRPGTYVTVRINQWLSSDRNQTGDAFAASLDQPLVVDGIVVAQRGQTVGGRISDAVRAGRVQGTSRLGLQITDLTLVDGQVIPVQAAMLTRNGSTSVGRDVGNVAGTTALGAAIGAAAGWGRGAAIGAGAGAAAGVAGVLLTRGNPTVIYPETVLTFRVDAPIEIATDRAPQAFRYADTQDYRRAPYSSGPGGPASVAGNCYNCAAPPVARPYPVYGPGYYPYYPYYGATFGFYSGRGYFGFRGRGYRR